MNIAIIVAGGSSTRFGSDKLQAKIGGKTVFETSLEAFEKHSEIDQVLVVGSDIPGGKTRFKV